MLFRIAIPFVFMLLSFNINADETGWYVGGVVGYASTKAETNNVFNQKESAESYGPYGGFNFTEWFGLEGMMILTGNVANNRANLTSAEFFGIIFTPKITYRLNKLSSLYVKAGFAWLDYEENYNGSVFITNRLSKESWDGFVTAFAIGWQFNIVKELKGRISYDRTTGRLSSDRFLFSSLPNVEAELNQVLFGLHYQF